MSKSFREKKTRDRDILEDMSNRKKQPKNIKLKEKVVNNALRAKDIETLMRFSEEEN